MTIVNGRQSGFTLLELMIVLAIIGALMAFFAPDVQRYVLRAKAAGVVVNSRPILRAIEDYQATIDRNRYRVELANGADGSITGCQAPAGSTCAAAGATTTVIVKPEQLLITDGTIRVSAAPCYVDCPGFALNFSSDVNLVPASPAAPAAPATPASSPSPAVPADSAPAAPGQDQSKGGGKGSGKGKQGALEEWPGRSVLSSFSVPFVSSAHAAEAGGSFTRTNRVLYEFGEVTRKRAHAVDNATCLFSTGTCTVTIKY